MSAENFDALSVRLYVCSVSSALARMPAEGRPGIPARLLVHNRQGQLPQAGGLPEGCGAGPQHLSRRRTRGPYAVQ